MIPHNFNLHGGNLPILSQLPILHSSLQSSCKLRILHSSNHLANFQSSTFGYEIKSILNKIWWTFDGVAGQNLDLASVVAAFFFDPSERNKVQEHFKITSQLVFLMVPTSPASFVQIGALWFFFLPRVPPLDIFCRILIKCKKVAFFVFRDTDPIFWLDTQDCPRNNSKALPPGVTPCFAEKSTLWCTGFCVLASSSQAPGVKKVSFPKLFPF